MAAPIGLTLEHVEYPADEDLAAQAALARRRREGAVGREARR
jgi:hypothetical protein